VSLLSSGRSLKLKPARSYRLYPATRRQNSGRTSPSAASRLHIVKEFSAVLEKFLPRSRVLLLFA